MSLIAVDDTNETYFTWTNRYTADASMVFIEDDGDQKAGKAKLKEDICKDMQANFGP